MNKLMVNQLAFAAIAAILLGIHFESSAIGFAVFLLAYAVMPTK